MQTINSTETLREAIKLLELKKANEAQLLKEEFKISLENFKPANLIKNVLNELVSTPDLKEDIATTAVSLAVGYLSKKVAIGATHNPLKQIAGTLLQMFVTNFTSKNATGIKAAAMDLIHTIFSKKQHQ